MLRSPCLLLYYVHHISCTIITKPHSLPPQPPPLTLKCSPIAASLWKTQKDYFFNSLSSPSFFSFHEYFFSWLVNFFPLEAQILHLFLSDFAYLNRFFQFWSRYQDFWCQVQLSKVSCFLVCVKFLFFFFFWI